MERSPEVAARRRTVQRAKTVLGIFLPEGEAQHLANDYGRMCVSTVPTPLPDAPGAWIRIARPTGRCLPYYVYCPPRQGRLLTELGANTTAIDYHTLEDHITYHTQSHEHSQDRPPHRFGLMACLLLQTPNPGRQAKGLLMLCCTVHVDEAPPFVLQPGYDSHRPEAHQLQRRCDKAAAAFPQPSLAHRPLPRPQSRWTYQCSTTSSTPTP